MNKLFPSINKGEEFGLTIKIKGCLDEITHHTKEKGIIDLNRIAQESGFGYNLLRSRKKPYNFKA